MPRPESGSKKSCRRLPGARFRLERLVVVRRSAEANRTTAETRTATLTPPLPTHAVTAVSHPIPPPPPRREAKLCHRPPEIRQPRPASRRTRPSSPRPGPATTLPTTSATPPAALLPTHATTLWTIRPFWKQNDHDSDTSRTAGSCRQRTTPTGKIRQSPDRVQPLVTIRSSHRGPRQPTRPGRWHPPPPIPPRACTQVVDLRPALTSRLVTPPVFPAALPARTMYPRAGYSR
ncbi:hypothetical protein CLV71_113190 [Actinophytocola oryzae]|uniref:Uncharacterized protein n=1 Tax=Actinophytocola oryzae TaxID=502181 RepID=A0A4V3FRU9_9PSEU|nr:hypothetical protein CLV71_113190 [Actinophytocola oryzae]